MLPKENERETAYWVQTIARNSYKHRQKKRFLKFIKTTLVDWYVMMDEKQWEELGKCSVESWQILLAENDIRITTKILEVFEEILFEQFTEVGEVIASVGYDCYGPAHSGWNGVYELCGVYLLSGSDFNEGPSMDKRALLSYLYTEEPENPAYQIYWTKFAD